jgi:hypothetical protein
LGIKQFLQPCPPGGARFVSCREDSSDLYVIYGKAKMCQKGEVIKKPSVAVTAQLQEGKWYFSTIADVLVD